MPTGREIGLSPRAASPQPTPVTMEEINNRFTRPAMHARLVYCSATSVTNLSCGAPCDALKDIKIVTAGGDDMSVPGYYIADDPVLKSVVVAHQGTKTDSVQSILNDIDFRHTNMNPKFFPKAPSDVEVHAGFHRAHGRTAESILLHVNQTLATTGYKKVSVFGQSLGAALAQLDGVLMKMNFPEIEVEVVVFASPRIGNKAYANMTDQLLPNLAQITNGHDPVPLTPLTSLKYQRSSGEYYIEQIDASGVPTMVACPGQENDNCISKNSVHQATFADHVGPYFNGIAFGANSCTL